MPIRKDSNPMEPMLEKARSDAQLARDKQAFTTLTDEQRKEFGRRGAAIREAKKLVAEAEAVEDEELTPFERIWYASHFLSAQPFASPMLSLRAEKIVKDAMEDILNKYISLK